jgi:hypothetical protein
MTEWIKCSDEQPKNHEECFIAYQMPEIPERTIFYGSATFRDGVFYFYKKSLEIKYVYYWSTLPPPLDEKKFMKLIPDFEFDVQ